MNVAVWIVGALALVALVAVVYDVETRQPWRLLRRRRVLVQITGERAISGILWARRGPLLILRDASTTLAPNTNPVIIDGEVVIERHRVAWMQVLL